MYYGRTFKLVFMMKIIIKPALHNTKLSPEVNAGDAGHLICPGSQIHKSQLS